MNIKTKPKNTIQKLLSKTGSKKNVIYRLVRYVLCCRRGCAMFRVSLWLQQYNANASSAVFFISYFGFRFTNVYN